jgi:hypothetical protein
MPDNTDPYYLIVTIYDEAQVIRIPASQVGIVAKEHDDDAVAFLLLQGRQVNVALNHSVDLIVDGVVHHSRAPEAGIDILTVFDAPSFDGDQLYEHVFGERLDAGDDDDDDIDDDEGL